MPVLLSQLLTSVSNTSKSCVKLQPFASCTTKIPSFAFAGTATSRLVDELKMTGTGISLKVKVAPVRSFTAELNSMIVLAGPEVGKTLRIGLETHFPVPSIAKV